MWLRADQMNAATEKVEWITRAECARRFGISGAAITKCCQLGMPSRRSDDMIAWPDVLYWSDFYRSPRSSGNWYARHPEDSSEIERREMQQQSLRRASAVSWMKAYRAGIDATTLSNRVRRMGS